MYNMVMKILLVGGGSGGHLTPLLAVAASFKKLHPQAEMRLWTDKEATKGQSVAGFSSVQKVLSGKYRRYQQGGKRFIPWKDRLRNFRDLFLLAAGFVQSFFRLLFWRPNAIFLKGGFVSLPVGLAAAALRIPFIIHESDTHMGLTNKVLSRYAAVVALGLPQEGKSSEARPLGSASPTERRENRRLSRVVGIPVASSWEQARLMSDTKAKKRLLEVVPELKILAGPLVVVVGGSLGARHLNQVASSFKLPAQTVILAGPNAHPEFGKKHITLSSLSLEQGLPELLRLADVVIARAGATTLTELAILGKPTIIVPKDVLPGGHQTSNAARLAAADAAVVIPEEQIDTDLQPAALRLLNNSAHRRRLARNIGELSVTDASQKIAKLIGQVTEQKPNTKTKAKRGE